MTQATGTKVGSAPTTFEVVENEPTAEHLLASLCDLSFSWRRTGRRVADWLQAERHFGAKPPPG